VFDSKKTINIKTIEMAGIIFLEPPLEKYNKTDLQNLTKIWFATENFEVYHFESSDLKTISVA
jgi:hypothetical protein